MSNNNRRDRYWQYYELSKKCEKPHMKRTLIQLVQEMPCPHKERSKRGRPPVHSKEKLDFLYLIMMADNNTYRGVIADFEDMRTPWDDEPIPDYSWLVKHTADVSYEWMDMILAETARRCLAEVAGSTGPLGADSSGIETTRYEMVEKNNKKEDDKVKTRQKTYWKYHIAAILGLQVILSTVATPSNVQDTTVLPTMLANIKRQGFDVSGSVFNADKGYDSDDNCEELFQMDMTPNIKQRKNATNQNKPSRRRAAQMFDKKEYSGEV